VGSPAAAYVVGIDAGASRTRALALDRDGRALRTREAAGANLLASPDALARLRDVIAAVTDGAAPAAIAVCAAGTEDERTRARLSSFLAEALPRVHAVIAHDAVAALYAATPRGVGVVLISGTGAIAYGRDAEGHETRASGWGHLIGDEGSVAWLGLEALRAAVRAADGRGEPTALGGAILAELGVPDLREALPHLYGVPHPAPAVLAAFRALGAVLDRDEVAQRIVAAGADELARAAQVVAVRLNLDDVFLSGGAFEWLPPLERATRERLAALLPRARVERSGSEPVRGAARIAAHAAWGDAR
jgi:N-acetylglucosamine kinase-like BadF-type ATPase